MSEEIIIIVDKNDEVIGSKNRDDITPEDIFRTAALWLTNSKGEILLAQRSLLKVSAPGKWGPATAGTVEKGETYDTNIIKEVEEEIGLTDVKFVKGPKMLDKHKYQHFTQWYTASIDKEVKDFNIDPKEVTKVRWASKEEIEEELKNNPESFLPNMPSYFKLLT